MRGSGVIAFLIFQNGVRADFCASISPVPFVADGPNLGSLIRARPDLGVDTTFRRADFQLPETS